MSPRRCYVCEARKVPCCSPPPDESTPWGYAEWLALGAMWMHTSANDRARLSYGSAIDAYGRAIKLATTDAEWREARLGYLGAWRCSLSQTRDGTAHTNAAPMPSCSCPACLDARGTWLVRNRCRVCGGSGHIRPGEEDTARITGRAHIDCDEHGHGGYGPCRVAPVMK